MTIFRPKLALAATCSLLLSTLATLPAVAQQSSPGPKAEKGYWISVFTKGNDQYSAPDSIAVTKDRVFIGYGDGNAPDGSDGKSSNILEYTKDGELVHVFTVVGHNDGLKVDPKTHNIWAMQNEDANPNLVIIDPETNSQTLYTFATATQPHGGGYDDIVFRNGKVYFSASNPANNPNNAPAIVEAKITGNTITTSPVLEGNAAATDVVTGQQVTLNLQDPDSMTLDPAGDLLMTSQADGELILVRKPGTQSQTVLQIPLTSPYGGAQADDTVFTPSGEGVILVADTPANIVYAIHKKEFAPGIPYTAAVAGTEGFVSRLDLDFGLLTPVVTGLQSPHGMGFVKTSNDDDDQDHGGCENR